MRWPGRPHLVEHGQLLAELFGIPRTRLLGEPDDAVDVVPLLLVHDVLHVGHGLRGLDRRVVERTAPQPTRRHRPLEERQQPIAGLRSCPGPGVHRVRDPLLQAAQVFLDDRRFARKVLVERSFGHCGCGGEPVHAGGVDALAMEQIGGGVQNAFASAAATPGGTVWSVLTRPSIPMGLLFGRGVFGTGPIGYLFRREFSICGPPPPSTTWPGGPMRFAADVIRPVAPEYDARQSSRGRCSRKLPRGFYSPLFYRDLIGDPTGLSPADVHGGAVLGLRRHRPGDRHARTGPLGHRAGRHAEQMLQWAPECFGTPGDLKLAALAISEPRGGSDVHNLRTSARRDGASPDADWIIDGHKMWIGNGGIANVHIVNAVVDEELGHRGQALFIVRRRHPGLELVRKLDKLGCRASHTAELRFDGVRSRRETCWGCRQARTQAGEGTQADGTRNSAALGTFSRPGRWWPRRRLRIAVPHWNT